MRLEPSSRDPELAPGLEGRIHDPLWMLGRQWQFGEFEATDGGSPIAAEVTAQTTPHPNETDPTTTQRVRAGQQFERLLAAHGLTEWVEPLRAAYPVPDAPPLLAGRTLDGVRLAQDRYTLPAALAAAMDEFVANTPLTAVPHPVTYPGMPAERLWEFEDARTDLDAPPDDLGGLLVRDAAFVYGGDWLVFALPVPTGGVTRIVRLDVRDSFGHTTTVGPTAPQGEWRMFDLSRAR